MTPLTALFRVGEAIVYLPDAFEAFLITGRTGSGKSTTSGKTLARAFLRAGMGGLVLTAKRDDSAVWREYMKAERREDDLIVFSRDSGHLFDPIAYEWEAGGRNIESLIEIFNTLLSIGKKHTDTSSDRFWELSVEELMRMAITLLALSGEPISIVNINKLIASFPTAPGEYETADWQEQSYCAAVISLIRERQEELSLDEWQDLDIATHYVCIRWPSLDERTRSNILATWSGLASKMLLNPMNRIFNSGQCSFTPEMTTQGKVILIDFPILQFNETGRLINCMMKLIFQRAWLRRDLAQYPNPAFLWADEAQMFILPKGRDNAFQQVCRGSRIATVYLTQNILNISEELGETHLGSRTKAFLANLVTKICHTQSCFDTNKYMADLIGKEYRYLQSTHVGSDISMGRNEHLAYKLEPDAFTTLQKPDSVNPVAEAILYQGGKLFPNNRNHMLVRFSR